MVLDHVPEHAISPRLSTQHAIISKCAECLASLVEVEFVHFSDFLGCNGAVLPDKLYY
jgi:hypothetical protein